MNKQDAIKFSDAIQECLNKMYPSYHVKVTGTYGSANLTLRVTISEVEGGTAHTPEYLDLLSMAKIYNWPLDAFYYPALKTNVKLVGYKARSRKYPVIIETEDGNRYKTTEGAIDMALKWEAE